MRRIPQHVPWDIANGLCCTSAQVCLCDICICCLALPCWFPRIIGSLAMQSMHPAQISLNWVNEFLGASPILKKIGYAFGKYLPEQSLFRWVNSLSRWTAKYPFAEIHLEWMISINFVQTVLHSLQFQELTFFANFPSRADNSTNVKVLLTISTASCR